MCLPVSGEMRSKSFTIPSPCFWLHILIGEPPPIRSYCSIIFGVRRFAINGAKILKKKLLWLNENTKWLNFFTSGKAEESSLCQKTNEVKIHELLLCLPVLLNLALIDQFLVCWKKYYLISQKFKAFCIL